jgi:hypothetical protein
MCACRELADDLLMTAMDTVEDADGQPGVLEGEVVEGAEMCHSKRIGRGLPRSHVDFYISELFGACLHL